jgi:hypothetical protein
MRIRRTRRDLFEQQDGKCHYCSREMILDKHPGSHSSCTIDHKIPRADGGILADGAFGACFSCNANRAALPYEYFRANWQEIEARQGRPSPNGGKDRTRARSERRKQRKEALRQLAAQMATPAKSRRTRMQIECDTFGTMADFWPD